MRALILCVLLSGCSHMCAKTWETSTGVSHSAIWGDSVESHVSVGGGFAAECREDE